MEHEDKTGVSFPRPEVDALLLLLDVTHLFSQTVTMIMVIASPTFYARPLMSHLPRALGSSVLDFALVNRPTMKARSLRLEPFDTSVSNCAQGHNELDRAKVWVQRRKLRASRRGINQVKFVKHELAHVALSRKEALMSTGPICGYAARY